MNYDKTLSRNPEGSESHRDWTWTDDPEAISALDALLLRDGDRRASISRQSIQAAFGRVAFYLRHHDGSDEAVQLKRFLWSLCDEEHYVNLCKVKRILGWRNWHAVEVILSASLHGIIDFFDLDWLMEVSGEKRRMEHARAETGSTKTVDYPPTPRWLREHILELGPVDLDDYDRYEGFHYYDD